MGRRLPRNPTGRVGLKQLAAAEKELRQIERDAEESDMTKAPKLLSAMSDADLLATRASRGDLIAEALTETWGERCSVDQPGCVVCDAWAQYDDLMAERNAWRLACTTGHVPTDLVEVDLSQAQRNYFSAMERAARRGDRVIASSSWPDGEP